MKQVFLILIALCFLLTACSAGEQQEQRVNTQETVTAIISGSAEQIDPDAVFTITSGGKTIVPPIIMVSGGDMEPTIPPDDFYEEAPIVEYHEDFRCDPGESVTWQNYFLLDPPRLDTRKLSLLDKLPAGIYRMGFDISISEPDERFYYAAIRLKVN